MQHTTPGMRERRPRRRVAPGGPTPAGTAAAALLAALAAVAGLAGCSDGDPTASLTSATTAEDSLGGGPGRSSSPSSSSSRPESSSPPSTGSDPSTGPGAGSGPDTTAGDGSPAEGDVSGAALRDPTGITVGTVLFEVVEGMTRVTVQITDGGETNAFHGLVVHANDDPSNGEGCEADPDEPPDTWFVSADGHLTDGDDAGGIHQGDLPNMWVMADGRATAQVITDRMVPSELVGTAVVLHEFPNNAANVPVGENPSQYTPNSPRATQVTETTGNTGARIACGVVEAGGGAAGSPVR